jgi:hypothetical protein
MSPPPKTSKLLLGTKDILIMVHILKIKQMENFIFILCAYKKYENVTKNTNRKLN